MTSNTSIRVGIADDHAITRAALRKFFMEQEGMVLAGEAWNGASVIDLARKVSMDVLVLDLMMPDKGGLDVLPMIRAKSPDTGVLVFSSCPESHYALNAIRRGASGYLNKQCEPEEIASAVRIVASGHRYISPDVAELLISGISNSGKRHPHENLTDREFELLLHLARGEPSTDIAFRLALSPKTVSTYRSLILDKLGLRSSSALTHYAMVHGLID
jgi:DNA-binding NarL/FixJ family response regulator